MKFCPSHFFRNCCWAFCKWISVLFTLSLLKLPVASNPYFTCCGITQFALTGWLSCHRQAVEMTVLQIWLSTPQQPPVCTHSNPIPSGIFPSAACAFPLKSPTRWTVQIVGLLIEHSAACSAWINENYSKSKPPYQNSKQQFLSKTITVSLSNQLVSLMFSKVMAKFLKF